MGNQLSASQWMILSHTEDSVSASTYVNQCGRYDDTSSKLFDDGESQPAHGHMEESIE